MREIYGSVCLRALPKDTLTHIHYMLSAGLHLMNGLGQYFIHPGAYAQIMVMTNNLVTLCYTYS